MAPRHHHPSLADYPDGPSASSRKSPLGRHVDDNSYDESSPNEPLLHDFQRTMTRPTSNPDTHKPLNPTVATRLSRSDSMATVLSSQSSSSSVDNVGTTTPNRRGFLSCLGRGNSPTTESSALTHVSRNVQWTLAYTLVAFVGRSIWQQSVLATYVYLLQSDQASAVGYVTGVMGLCQFVASFPAGYLADCASRQRQLRGAALLGLVAFVVTLVALQQQDFRPLVLALGVWGIFWGITNTTVTALYADSIPDGQRSKYFTQRSVLLTLGNTAGPLVALAMFAVLGNEWTIHSCTVVMTVGQIVSLPALLMLCFLSDDEMVQSNAPTDPDPRALPVTTMTTTRITSARSDVVEKGSASGNNAIDASPLLLDQQSDEELNQERTEVCSSRNQEFATDSSFDDASSSTRDEVEEEVLIYGWLSRNRVIAVSIATADVVSGLGSGMSIRYFPIFFMKNLALGPVLVQVLYVVSPFIQSILMHYGQQLALTYGRCRITVVYKWMGIALMFLMIATYIMECPVWLICIICTFRTAFMNSTGGLTRSVLMDHVPPSERGRWSALESINMFSWSGSAVLGGLVVGMVGMMPLFVVTACIQFLSSLAVLATIPYEVMEQQPPKQSTTPSVLTFMSNSEHDSDSDVEEGVPTPTDRLSHR